MRGSGAKFIAAIEQTLGRGERIVLAVTGATVMVVLALATINAVTYEIAFFHLTSDFGLANVTCSLLFAGGAAAAWKTRSAGVPFHSTWTILAVVGAVLAVESMAAIHDRLEEVGSMSNILFVGYPLAGLVVLGFAVRPIARMKSPVPELLLSALGVLIFSQIAGGIISLYPDLWTPSFNLLMALGEGSEVLAGGLYFAAAAAALRLSNPDHEDSAGARSGVPRETASRIDP